MYTGEDFARETLASIRMSDSQRRTHQVLQRALRSPNLYDGYQDRLRDPKVLEFHMGQSPEFAIKAFSMNKAEPRWAHDHAGLWGLYGVYRGNLGMAFYRQVSPGVLEETERFVEQGQTIWVYPKDIHAVWSPVDGSLVLTIYNGDLNNLERRIFDLQKQGSMVRDRSQWERRDQGELRKLES